MKIPEELLNLIQQIRNEDVYNIKYTFIFSGFYGDKVCVSVWHGPHEVSWYDTNEDALNDLPRFLA